MADILDFQPAPKSSDPSPAQPSDGLVVDLLTSLRTSPAQTGGLGGRVRGPTKFARRLIVDPPEPTDVIITRALDEVLWQAKARLGMEEIPMVTGVAGVGKTTFVRKWAASRSGVAVVALPAQPTLRHVDEVVDAGVKLTLLDNADHLLAFSPRRLDLLLDTVKEVYETRGHLVGFVSVQCFSSFKRLPRAGTRRLRLVEVHQSLRTDPKWK